MQTHVFFIRLQALAEVWKKRGNELVKAEAYESAVDFYTLAMQYTEGTDTETMSKLLSNRSLSYLKGGQYQGALRDADNCVKFKPDWYRVRGKFAVTLFGL